MGDKHTPVERAIDDRETKGGSQKLGRMGNPGKADITSSSIRLLGLHVRRYIGRLRTPPTFFVSLILHKYSRS